MSISLADVLAGKPRIRTKTVDYGDGLVFQIKSFTAAAFRELADELTEHAEDEGDDRNIGIAIRFIEGEDHKPTQSEIDAFRKNLDLGVIESLVYEGLSFNRGAIDLVDSAKKS